MTLLSLQQTHAVRHPDYHAESYPDSPEYHTSRCFGKTLLISTLEAYFQGKKELFEGLAMEKLEKDWIRYPVLHLVHPGRFINIEITVLTDFLEILDSDGIYFIAHTFFNALS